MGDQGIAPCVVHRMHSPRGAMRTRVGHAGPAVHMHRGVHRTSGLRSRRDHGAQEGAVGVGGGEREGGVCAVVHGAARDNICCATGDGVGRRRGQAVPNAVVGVVRDEDQGEGARSAQAELCLSPNFLATEGKFGYFVGFLSPLPPVNDIIIAPVS